MEMLNHHCGIDRDSRGVVRLTICNAGSLNILGSSVINGVREGLEQLEYYRRMLLDLGDTKKTSDQTVLAIFSDAQTKLRKPANLKALTSAIDKLDWYSAREEGLLVGISSGATLAAIAQKLPEIAAGATVLGFNYDTGERYLSIEGFLPAE